MRHIVKTLTDTWVRILATPSSSSLQEHPCLLLLVWAPPSNIHGPPRRTWLGVVPSSTVPTPHPDCFYSHTR